MTRTTLIAAAFLVIFFSAWELPLLNYTLVVLGVAILAAAIVVE